MENDTATLTKAEETALAKAEEIRAQIAAREKRQRDTQNEFHALCHGLYVTREARAKTVRHIARLEDEIEAKTEKLMVFLDMPSGDAENLIGAHGYAVAGMRAARGVLSDALTAIDARQTSQLEAARAFGKASEISEDRWPAVSPDGAVTIPHIG